MKRIKLSIPAPCHENWEAMSPSEKGKFCASCQKTVTDFTHMSDRELFAFFNKPVNSVCGRLTAAQLDRENILPRKKFPLIHYFFTVSIPAFLISSRPIYSGVRSVSGTQTFQTAGSFKKPGLNIQREQITQADTTRKTEKKDSFFNKSDLIMGDISVVDSKKVEEPIEHIILPEGTDSTLQQLRPQPSYINRENYIEAFTGGITAGVAITQPKNEPVSFIKNFMDSLFTKFTIFPNPVQKGGGFYIRPGKMPTGEYALLLINNSGQVVNRKEVELNNNDNSVMVETSNAAAGVYIVELYNKEKQKTFSQKLVIQ